jgi:glycosyl-4,4'-diaponeurosporenoate acyltransferase
MRVATPVGRLPWWAVVLGNTAFWPVWTVAAGFVTDRASLSRFAHDDAITRLRAFEGDGNWYRDHLDIHAWKDRLPEAGAAFGGFAKRSVRGGDVEHLQAFVVETRRAEHAHWRMLAGVVVTCAWNPWWAFPANMAFAVGSNLPCIAVQRYNRARLDRLIRRSRLTYGR